MSIEYTVQATVGKQSKEYQIIVEPQSGPDGAPPSTCFRVVVDGQEMQVEARRFDERGSVVSWLLLDAAGAQRIVDVAGDAAADTANGGSNFRVSVGGGEPIQLKAVDSREIQSISHAVGGAATGGELRAAMPGKVVKVLCKAGDSVKAGQGLLVIEAMKMENELRAPAAGKVTTVSAKEGQAVESGQVLLHIGPAD